MGLWNILLGFMLDVMEDGQAMPQPVPLVPYHRPRPELNSAFTGLRDTWRGEGWKSAS